MNRSGVSVDLLGQGRVWSLVLFRGLVWVLLVAGVLVCGGMTAQAQDNYEIQVYGSDTVLPGMTMFELHSNFTLDGSKAVKGSKYTADGTFPTHHAVHETIEITRGLNKWSELGFYIFMDASQASGARTRGRIWSPTHWYPDAWLASIKM